MNVANIWKLTAKILGILGVLASIIYAIADFDYTDGFSLLIGLAGIIASGMLFLSFYTVGEIVEKLNDIDYHLTMEVENSCQIGLKLGVPKK